MMILASFARTFKEGQAYITPFYLLIMLPVMFLQTPGLHFSLGLAFVPIVNVVMLIRTIISGVFLWPQIGITLAVSAAMILGAIRVATYVLRFEDVMLGSYSGSFNRFFAERVLKRAPKTARRGAEGAP
jgi:sodium transport system permease protein